MKYFTKITQDEYDERILWFLKNPLRFAVYYLCYTRARRTNSEIKTNNLKINEFYLSRCEYEKFGLKENQAGQIIRVISDLIKNNFIKKVDNKIGNKNCYVYSFIPNNIVNWIYKTDNKTDNKQTTDRQQTDTNIDSIDSKIDKKDIYKDIISKDITQKEYGNKDINILIAYLKEKLELPALDETVETNRRYCYLILRKFGNVEKIKLLIDITAKDNFWSTKVTSFKTLFYKAVQIMSDTRNRKDKDHQFKPTEILI